MALKAFMVVNRDSFFLSHRLPQALAIQALGIQLSIVAEDTGSSAAIASRGFEFIPLPIKRRSLNPFQEWKTIAFLYRLYKSRKPDLVHHVTPKPLFYGTIAARLLGNIPTINAIVGLGSSLRADAKFNVLQSLVRLFYRFGLRHPNMKVIFMNRDNLKTFQDLKLLAEPSQAVVIRGSGVDLDVFSFSPEDTSQTTVMFASRLLRDKGIFEFIAAARIVRLKYPNVNFVIVGDPDPGNPSAVSADQLEVWKAEEIFEFWGYRKDMASVLEKASMVVLPTYGEGLPKALLEAAAVGRAIIASDVPGCRECVIDQVTGLLVPPMRVPELVSAIESLLADPIRRARMGAQGRNLVEREFGVEIVSEKITALYKDLLQLPRRGLERSKAPLNIFSIDVEDWFHILDLKSTPDVRDWSLMPSRVEQNFYKLLETLDRANVRATCFFLGWVAESFPKLVQAADAAGHEIASHGYSHRLVYSMSQEEFRADVTRAKKTTEDLLGKKVFGYRAPGFSINEKTPWAFDILKELGFDYDSSIFPAAHGHGGQGSASMDPYEITTPYGVLTEFPITVLPVFGKRLCFFGGGYFRLFPYQLIRQMGRKVNSNGRPMIVYLHPRDIDPDQPRLSMGRLRAFKSYVNLGKTEAKVGRILNDFHFGSFRDYLQQEAR